MDSKIRMKRARDRIKSLGLKKNRQFVKLVCKICNRIEIIRVNDKSLYTDEVISKYACYFCKK